MTILYIDPGTGSMLFSLFIGVAATAAFAIRAVVLKIKMLVNRGKRAKIDNSNLGIVIYSDSKRYWNVFKPICDEFERREKKAIYWTQSKDDPALKENYKYVKAAFIGEKNKGIARMNFLNADLCLSTTPELDVLQWKRSKLCKCYVHVPHTVDDLSGYRMFGLDFYDAVLTTGRNQNNFIRKIESLRPNTSKKELCVVGSPNLDAMKERADKSAREKKQNEKKTVLVAPSWGKSGILSRYGEEFISALKKTKFNIIIRPHPQTVVSEQKILKPLMEKFNDIEWNYDNDNFEVLNKADVLITDFSGIIFDFSLVFDKPLIYADTHFDSGSYDASWLQEQMWSLRTLPKIGFQLRQEDFENLESVINNSLSSKKLSEGRDEIRAECWENAGESAKRIVDYLISKQKSLMEA